MASRDRTSRWAGLRPWQILHPRLAENNVRGNSGMEIWGLLDELMGGAPYRAPRYNEPGISHVRHILDGEEDPWGHGGMMETRVRDWVVSRSLEMDESRARPIDTRAVLAKCRTEVYKPKSRGAGSRSVAVQEDCPVCLEKFVAEHVLYRLPCNHLFHKDCLTPWIQSNHGDCPCCRADILGSSTSTPSANPPRVVRPVGATANSGSVIGERSHPPPSSYHTNRNSNTNTNTNSNTSRSTRRESDDIMSVLTAMEAALDSLGFRTY